MKITAVSILLWASAPFGAAAAKCKITGSSGTKACRWYPAENARNHADLKAGNTYNFKCWARGEKVGSNG